MDELKFLPGVVSTDYICYSSNKSFFLPSNYSFLIGDICSNGCGAIWFVRDLADLNWAEVFTTGAGKLLKLSGTCCYIIDGGSGGTCLILALAFLVEPTISGKKLGLIF